MLIRVCAYLQLGALFGGSLCLYDLYGSRGSMDVSGSLHSRVIHRRLSS